MKAEIEEIMEHGVIDESHSEWSAPIVIVKKMMVHYNFVWIIIG